MVLLRPESLKSVIAEPGRPTDLSSHTAAVAAGWSLAVAGVELVYRRVRSGAARRETGPATNQPASSASNPQHKAL